MLGATLSEEQQMLVNYESERYEDIVQADFIDSYYNTFKIIYNFKWVCYSAWDILLECTNSTMHSTTKLPCSDMIAQWDSSLSVLPVVWVMIAQWASY